MVCDKECTYTGWQDMSNGHVQALYDMMASCVILPPDVAFHLIFRNQVYTLPRMCEKKNQGVLPLYHVYVRNIPLLKMMKD